MCAGGALAADPYENTVKWFKSSVANDQNVVAAAVKFCDYKDGESAARTRIAPKTLQVTL